MMNTSAESKYTKKEFPLFEKEIRRQFEDRKLYILFRNGLYKATYNFSDGCRLIGDGWYDHTKYKSEKEVKLYEIQTKCNPNEIYGIEPWCAGKTSENDCSSKQLNEEVRGDGNSSSEREKPQYQQCNANICDDSGKKLETKTVRSGPKCSEVNRKRGRPKKGM